MRIENTNIPNDISSAHSAQSQKGGRVETKLRADAAHTVNRAERPADVTELKQLVTELQKVPEVRTDLVETAKLRLAQGDYDTAASAEATARAILEQLGG